MTPIALGVAVALFAGVITLRGWLRRGSRVTESQRQAIDAVALGLGLEPDRVGRHWHGTIDGFPAELILKPEEWSPAPGFWLELGGLPRGVTIGPRRAREPEAALNLATRRIQVGDPALDTRADVRGDDATALAMLGWEVRWPLARLVARSRGTLERGVLRSYLTPGLSHPDEIRASVQPVIELAAQLRARAAADRASRLAANVETDRVWAVALTNLLILGARFPSSPLTATAARSAMASRRAELKLEGAILLGVEGLDALGEIGLYSTVEDSLRVRAIEALQDLPGERVMPILQPFWSSRSQRIARAALASAATADRDGLRKYLIEHLPVAAAARAELWAEQLGSLPGDGVAAALAGLLKRRQRSVQLAAVRALAYAGDIESVEDLAPLRDASGELGEAARRSIATIQGGLADVAGGRLSVASRGGGGELALADEDRGELSLAPPERDDDGANR